MIESEILNFIDEDHGDPYSVRTDNSSPLVINAAVTGMVPTRQNAPHVPLSVEEIIADGTACAKSGASILHIHARDEGGNPTWDPGVYADIIAGIRAKSPEIVICASTSGRLWNTLEKRSATLYLEGDAKPDMASLAMGSMNFPTQSSVNNPEMIQALANIMQERGIKPEVEIFEPGMLNYAKYLTRKGILSQPYWFNLMFGSLGTIPAGVRDFEYLTGCLPEGARWGVGGIGRYQLPVNLMAILKGGHVRVGLEDNLYMDHGKTIHATNVGLIERLKVLAVEAGRSIASPSETRSMLGMN